MPDKQNETNYLTTNSEWGIEYLLDNCGRGDKVLIIVEVQPKHSRIGLLEERGRWTQEFWNKVLQEIPGIHGQGLLWTELIFIYPGSDIESVERQFAKILQASQTDQLKSRCILSHIDGDVKEIWAEIERMENSFKEWYFGDMSLFKYWLVEGNNFQK